MKVQAFFAAVCSCGLVLAGGAGRARAQMSPDLIMETYNSNINAITTSSINKHVLDAVIRRHNGARGSSKGRGAKRGKTATAARNVATTYTPSPQITTALCDDLVAKVRARDPKNADAVAKVFHQYNFVTIWRGLVAPYGLKTNDLADAMASYLVLGWIVANGRTDRFAAGRGAKGGKR